MASTKTGSCRETAIITEHTASRLAYEAYFEEFGKTSRGTKKKPNEVIITVTVEIRPKEKD